MLDMLRANPAPGDEMTPRRRAGASVAWKTGTSFGFRDAWAVGVVGRYVLGVWVGNFDGTPNPAFVGREAAGPLFFGIVDALRARGRAPAPAARRRRALVRTSGLRALRRAARPALPGPQARRG